MSTQTVSITNYGARLKLDDQDRRARVVRALYKAALIGETIVAQKTPVDRGQARNAWAVTPTATGAELYNDAPHAGILELGSRPHRPPLRPILEWVVRKFGTGKNTGKKSFVEFSEVEPHLFGIAKAIVRKIEAEGTRPHYMVRDSLPKLAEITKKQVEKALGDW